MGGEYERLHSLFRQVGITHHVSCPYAQQQNGVAERKHRHIVEMGLSLLATADMPLKYWDEAFLAATYLINRTPTKLLNFDTPLHMLVGATLDYSSFRVFGCVCWPNLRPYNSHKLQYRSIRCVFLGYSNMHKGFKCLDISTGRLYISRDVVFDEKTFPFAALHSTAGASYSSDVLLLPDASIGNNLSINVDESPACFPLPIFGSCVQSQVAATLGSASVPEVAGPDPMPNPPPPVLLLLQHVPCPLLLPLRLL
jgi:hypothetical protein